MDDFIGKKFGKLTVLCLSEPIIRSGQKRKAYLCECECGTKKTIAHINLTCLNQQSCGCLNSHSNPEGPRVSSAKQIYHKYNDGDLSFNDFFNLSQRDCYYCGKEPSNCLNMFKHKRTAGRSCSDFAIKHGNFIYNGLDRKDNRYPHNKNNCVPCCWTCNNAKGVMSLREFKAWIRKVYRHIENV